MNNFVFFGRLFNQHLLIASWHETPKAGRCYGPSVTEWRTLFQGSDSSSSIPFSDVASSYAQGKRWVIGMKEEYEDMMYEIQNILIRFSWYPTANIIFHCTASPEPPHTWSVRERCLQAELLALCAWYTDNVHVFTYRPFMNLQFHKNTFEMMLYHCH